MRTRQEIFNLAWNGLKAQGFKRSIMVGSDRCLYRSQNGLKCAIGHCIQDHSYHRDLEDAPYADVLDAAEISSAEHDFTRYLQVCHDNSTRPKKMEQALRRFASEHSLTIPA